MTDFPSIILVDKYNFNSNYQIYKNKSTHLNYFYNICKTSTFEEECQQRPLRHAHVIVSSFQSGNADMPHATSLLIYATYPSCVKQESTSLCTPVSIKRTKVTHTYTPNCHVLFTLYESQPMHNKDLQEQSGSFKP